VHAWGGHPNLAPVPISLICRHTAGWFFRTLFLTDSTYLTFTARQHFIEFTFFSAVSAFLGIYLPQNGRQSHY
jgi:hypothetical protein